MRKFIKIVIVVVLAFAANLVLFLTALQMGESDMDREMIYNNAIKITQIEQEKVLEPPKPKEPEQTKTVARPQARTVSNRPQVNINMPKLNIDINPRLNTGFTIDPSQIGVVEQPPGPISTFSGVYGLEEVDVAPSVLRSVQPEYPYSAKRQGITGVVEVKCLVGANGVVESVSITGANPKGIFEDAVLVAVRKWRFKAGVKDGQNVPTWVVFPVRFELN